MRSREASPALLHAACCHEYHSDSPGVPPAGLCSGPGARCAGPLPPPHHAGCFSLVCTHREQGRNGTFNGVTYCHVFNPEQFVPEHRFPGLLEQLLSPAGSPLAASQPGTCHGSHAATCPCSSQEIAGQTVFRHKSAPASATP